MSALSPEQLKVFIAEQQAALVAAQDALAQVCSQLQFSFNAMVKHSINPPQV